MNILLLIQAATAISVASTPATYTGSASDPNYASPSTIEPSVDYKTNAAGHGQFARQFFEPISPPSLANQYAESLQSLNAFTPKPYLVHRLPFLPSIPYPPHPSLPSYGGDQPAAGAPYNLHALLPPSPAAPPQTYPLAEYAANPASLFDQHYNPFAFQQKYAKNPTLNPLFATTAGVDCGDIHPSAFRNTRPILFRPYKADNIFEPSLLAKPANALYRFQPPPYASAAFGANIYH